MLRFPLWKKAMIWAVVIAGFLFALPNLFDPASRPAFLVSSALKLGLDLRGGAYLLLEVDPGELHTNRLRSLSREIAIALNKRPGNVRFRNREVRSDVVRLRLPDEDQIDLAIDRIKSLSEPVGGPTGADSLNITRIGNVLEIGFSEAQITALKREALEDSIEVVRRRIDAAGTVDPNVLRQGADRIMLEVPGVDDPQSLIDIITRTGVMSINLVDEAADISAYEPGIARMGKVLLPFASGLDQYVVFEDPIITGKELASASQSFDERGTPQINFTLKGRGPKIFGDFTLENTGRSFAIVLDDQLVSVARVRTPILTGAGRITGNFTIKEAEDIAVVLRAGELPARLHVVERRVVGAGLGADSIRSGTVASLLGLTLVALFMIVIYGLPGLFAVISLAINLVLIIGALSGLGAALTLPGIAGIILTIGMAVDANVLVYERIREEVRNGRSPASAVEAGYSRALSAIMDANITTLIAAIVLLQFGSGPVRGFAVTLGVGIVSSVFTAFILTRAIMATWLSRFRPQTLSL